MSVWTLNETLKQVGANAQTGSETGFISNGESFTGMVYIKSGSILKYYTSNGFIVVYENQMYPIRLYIYTRKYRIASKHRCMLLQQHSTSLYRPF